MYRRRVLGADGGNTMRHLGMCREKSMNSKNVVAIINRSQIVTVNGRKRGRNLKHCDDGYARVSPIEDV